MRNNERGFTLIEVVAGMVIIVVAVMGLSAAFVHTMTIEETNDQANLAINAARGKMEVIKKMGYDLVKATYSSGNPDNCSFDIDNLNPVSGQDHPGKVTVAALTPNYADIVIDIKFLSPSGDYAITSHARVRK